MSSIGIPIPDLVTQKAIADFLDSETARIDALVEKKQAFVRLANERLSSNLENLTFGDDSFNGMLIPVKWVCRVTEGQVDPRSEAWKDKPLIAPNHIEKGTGRLSAVESADEQAAISGKHAFPAGTVLYSKIRPALMKACIAPEAGLCSADMHPIIPGSKLLPNFLLMQLLSKSFTDWAILESMRIAMPKINRERLGPVRLVVPPTSKQRDAVAEFTRIRAKIDRFVDLTQKSVSALTELRASLITAAVTGRIDPATYRRHGTTDRALDQIEAEVAQ
jgi:type I restriction enzyme S subunit